MLTRLANFVQRPSAAARYPHPAELIQEPAVPAYVTRLSDDRLRVEWDWDADRVNIFAVLEPDDDTAGLKPVASITQGNAAVLPPLPHWPRPYLTLQFHGGAAGGRKLVVAERVLSRPHIINLRDVGGYETKNGRFVRWGQVYRSGALSRLTDADHESLMQLNVRLVCDLRSDLEVAAAPDLLPPATAYLHRSLSSSDPLWRQLRTLRRYRHRYEGFLRRIYIQTIVDENAQSVGDILRRLADPDQRPALFHCAVGKDRTGVTAALLLALLGVPDEVIVADYTLSNRYHRAIYAAMRPELQRARWAGIRPALLYPISLAQPQTMWAVLHHLRESYGGVERYLREEAGMDTAVVAALQDQLLT